MADLLPTIFNTTILSSPPSPSPPTADAPLAVTQVTLNYPTAAAASGDLGGIEYARNKASITIGLGTITYR
jgi:hypothetical protein